MDQAGIIRDLLIWLEGHLDQPLSLNVAAKAGYSRNGKLPGIVKMSLAMLLARIFVLVVCRNRRSHYA